MPSCSIHMVDNGVGGFFRSRHPRPEKTPGLLSAQRLTAAAFSGKQYPGAPQLGRNAFIAFWDDDAAIDSFVRSPEGSHWSDGWHVRCQVTRAIGRWPGLPTDVARDVKMSSDHPVVGISLGPLRLRHGVAFNKLNTRIEAQLMESEGVAWASAFFAAPATLCTVTIWESAQALHAFARSGAHAAGMQASLDKDFDPSLPNGTKFFKPDSIFMSLRPYHTTGSLAGKNPLPEHAFSDRIPLPDLS